ncbi:MAG: hypothetical protein V5A44_01300 [Haloarculaceae archaeon]
MSLTPLDESEGEPREGGRPTGDSSDEHTGFLGRVRGAIGRVFAALSGRADSREATVETGDRRSSGDPLELDGDGSSTTALDARSAERSLTWADGPEDDPRDSGETVDRPDLVASWDDRGLTLSESDASDASISSDTWTDVER